MAFRIPWLGLDLLIPKDQKRIKTHSQPTSALSEERLYVISNDLHARNKNDWLSELTRQLKRDPIGEQERRSD